MDLCRRRCGRTTLFEAVSVGKLPDGLCVRLGHCRHWGELGSTSAMQRIADSGGVEQPDGTFRRHRTHTSDPKRSLGRSSANGRNGRIC